MNAEIIIPKAIEVRKSLNAGIVDLNALQQLLTLIENSYNPQAFTPEQNAYINHAQKLEQGILRRKNRRDK